MESSWGSDTNTLSELRSWTPTPSQPPNQLIRLDFQLESVETSFNSFRFSIRILKPISSLSLEIWYFEYRLSGVCWYWQLFESWTKTNYFILTSLGTLHCFISYLIQISNRFILSHKIIIHLKENVFKM